MNSEGATCGLVGQGAGCATLKDERSEPTRTKNTCRELLEVEPAMGTFLTRPEIGMTNSL